MPNTKVVSPEEWQAARAPLLQKEKDATRLLSSLASERRELPMTKVPDPASFTFKDTNGKSVNLLDLFEGRRQLVIYLHMPFSSNGDGCVGCSFFSDHVPNGEVLDHLHSRDTTFVATAPETPEKVKAFKERMGWTFPFYSHKDTFAGHDETVTWKPIGNAFRLNCFLREGDEVFHTWETTSRGTEVTLWTYALLDMTKLGRQEDGPMRFKLHDQY